MRWLKWLLISLGAVAAVLVLVVAVVLYLLTRPAPPSRVETISANWVLHHYDPWNPDGKHAAYLARRSAGGEKEISWKILNVRDIGDDCVVYSDWYARVYGVCGDRPPIYVGLIVEYDKADLKQEEITLAEGHYTMADIKRAAQAVEEQSAGGDWLAQRRAFPYFDDPGPYYVVFHEERLSHRRQVADSVTAYRYLGHDCLLYVDRAADKHDYPVWAGCGKRYQVEVGTAARPEDIQFASGPQIDGRTMAVSEITKKAMAEREMY